VDGQYRIDYYGRGTNKIVSTSWRDSESAAFEAADRRRAVDAKIGRARVTFEPHAGRLQNAKSVYAKRHRRTHAELHHGPALLAGLAVAAAAAVVFLVVRSNAAPAAPALTA
jgi:hypothetical protein